MIDHYFTCPHCWETISMLIDVSVNQQKYIEDCEVCCNPIEVTVTCEHGDVVSFDANPIGQ